MKMKMKIFKFSKLSEAAKKKAIYEFACNIDMMKSEYEIISELCKGEYKFTKDGTQAKRERKLV